MSSKRFLILTIIIAIVLVLSSCYFNPPLDTDGLDNYENIDATLPTGVSVDLKNQWRQNTTVSYDSSKYVSFESNSNRHKNNSLSYMKITLDNTYSGTREFSIWIASDAEDGRDYTRAYALDSDSSIRATSSSAKERWYKVTYNIPTGTHVIYVDYVKDSANSNGEDRGYVLIPKSW